MVSSRRPLPLRARADLVTSQLHGRQVGCVVKDPLALKYYRLEPEQWALLELLDARRSLEDLRQGVAERFPAALYSLAKIQSLVVDLHAKGLLISERPGQGFALLERAKETKARRWKRLGVNILNIRLPGWDPERTLAAIHPFVRWVYRPWAQLLFAAFVLSSLVLLVVQFDEFLLKLPEFHQFFGWPNLIYLWLTLALIKILHELGHGVTCRHMGAECHEISVIFLVFTPTLYCDASDSWILPNKWHRIAVGAAGMWVELVLSAAALFTWWSTQPGLLHHLCLNVFAVTMVTTTIFNANPLLRYDGYYMLSDFLEVPNLAQKSSALLRHAFARYCLGIELREDPFMPRSNRFWFGLYAVASTTYRMLVLFGICLFLYKVLKPYELQSIGATLALVSVGGLVSNMVWVTIATLRAPRLQPLNRPRLGIFLAAVFAVAACAVWLPLPWHIDAPFVIEPHDVTHVYNPVPGTLAEILVKEGDHVAGGETLLRLRDPAKELKILELEAQEESLQVEVGLRRWQERAELLEVARAQLINVREQLEDYRRQMALLEVAAAASGVVVAPPRLADPKIERVAPVLPAWYGTPLDRQNLGCLIEARTHLLSLAPDPRFQAVLFIDQADRADLAVGKHVEIKFDHLPTRVMGGTIQEFSQREASHVPAALSNKSGGEVPTITDSRGHERLAASAYQAVVVLDQETRLLRSGLRGRCRFLVAHRSAADWIWRWIRHTFHFRL
jgi:putative peptide zinc metalloprotease protein